MRDRVPRYPGRVKLTPVSGQANVYDMTRADSPTQEGDPINKSTLLKDSTAALYGLGDDATPNDVFAVIRNYVEKYLTIPEGTEDPAAYMDNLLDEYIATKQYNSIGFIVINTFVAHPDLSGGAYMIKVNVRTQDYVSLEAVSYGAPNNRGARVFTRSRHNGVWNEWRNSDYFEAGSYTGAGIYGESYKNSLTFGILPRFVLIFGPYSFAFYKWGDTTLRVADPIMGTMTENSVATAGKTMTWYTTTPGEGDGSTQLNGNKKYNYVAI